MTSPVTTLPALRKRLRDLLFAVDEIKADECADLTESRAVAFSAYMEIAHNQMDDALASLADAAKLIDGGALNATLHDLNTGKVTLHPDYDISLERAKRA